MGSTTSSHGGTSARAIYREPGDREHFLELLASTSAHLRWNVLAYCLMTNHYHLLVQTPTVNLARRMRQLNGIYAQAFNRRHSRAGHLFQGPTGRYLGEERVQARARYVNLVEGEEDLAPPAHPLVDGDDRSVSSHLQRIAASPEHPRALVAPPRPPLGELVTSEEDAAAIVHA